MTLNKAMIIGNLTRDPEVKTIPSGQNVAKFAVATNLVWKDAQTGEKKEKPEFHNIVAWGKLGEICGQYLKKGSKVYIEGRIQTRNWNDQNGVKHYMTEIIAENMIMLDRRNNQFAEANQSSQPTEPVSAPSEPVQNYSPAGPTASSDTEEIQVENIPF